MNEHRKTRRRHSAQFKQEVVGACREPGASVASVALAFGVNANLVRQWLRGRGFKNSGVAMMAATPPQLGTAPRQFVALALPAQATASPGEANADIRVDVRRGALQVNVSWPQSAAADCASWLRELLR